MQITIQTLNFKESPSLKELVYEKVEKLFKKEKKIIRIDVILKQGAAKNPENKWCELYISLPGENKFVKKNSDAYEKSVFLATAAVKKILRRNKI